MIPDDRRRSLVDVPPREGDCVVADLNRHGSRVRSLPGEFSRWTLPSPRQGGLTLYVGRRAAVTLAREMANPLKLGASLPAFSLPDQDGAELASESLLGRGPIVIFFYPKDESTGCTAEACAFRDHYEQFTDAGATVIGVSRDDAARHRRFIARHRLPFQLLTDRDGSIAARFGVPKTLGLLPGRSTYIFDASGALRHQFHSQIQATRHVEEARRIVEELASAAR